MILVDSYQTMRAGILIAVMTCMLSTKHRLDFVESGVLCDGDMQSDRNIENLENG